jgi:hypothetical protein
MTQSAAVRPEPTLYRKAALLRGAGVDHAGKARTAPMPGFDLNRTIFKTLESPLARFAMTQRIGLDVFWEEAAAREIAEAYAASVGAHPLPPVSPELLEFLLTKCDFDVEHADGSFLDHLYFCFEYAVRHGPAHAPLVMFLHSILGTGTNTFAMPASEIPALRALLSDFDFRHIESFPSVLRLLYTDLLERLDAEAPRLGQLRAITMHRVIDNAPLELSADDLWIALNYQLMHLVDFLPVADWSRNANDTNLMLFRRLRGLLVKLGKLEAKVDELPARGAVEAPPPTVGHWVLARVPEAVSWRMAQSTIARFSGAIGHSLDYTLRWA